MLGEKKNTHKNDKPHFMFKRTKFSLFYTLYDYRNFKEVRIPVFRAWDRTLVEFSEQSFCHPSAPHCSLGRAVRLPHRSSRGHMTFLWSWLDVSVAGSSTTVYAEFHDPLGSLFSLIDLIL